MFYTSHNLIQYNYANVIVLIMIILVKKKIKVIDITHQANVGFIKNLQIGLSLDFTHPPCSQLQGERSTPKFEGTL